MAIRTQDSISGFIASDPQLTYGDSGVARFYARFGQENYRQEEDGTFTQLEPSFHNLVLFRKTAEHAYEQFAKGDRFVAEGFIREYTYERDGQQVGGEEFVAKKIGHDTARSHYQVDRTPRQDAPAQQQATTRQAPAQQAPAGQEAPARRTPEQAQPFAAPPRPAHQPTNSAIAR